MLVSVSVAYFIHNQKDEYLMNVLREKWLTM
jgi:hypothetical protein